MEGAARVKAVPLLCSSCWVRQLRGPCSFGENSSGRKRPAPIPHDHQLKPTEAVGTLNTSAETHTWEGVELEEEARVATVLTDSSWL